LAANNSIKQLTTSNVMQRKQFADPLMAEEVMMVKLRISL
jgi:hypothetical protein